MLLPEEMLQNGDRREVEIRGCTIWAVEVSHNQQSRCCFRV